MKTPIYQLCVVGLSLSLLALLSPLYAQVPAEQMERKLPATKLPMGAKAPTIDGDVSDAVWQQIPAAETFYDPVTGKEMADKTLVYLTYDEKNIYIAFRCFDSQPGSIVARETILNSRFDGGGGGGQKEDAVDVQFDPFLAFNENDFRTFSVNPLGTRSTAGGGGRASKAEWQGLWEAASKRLPDGWSVEMRIPWAALNFPHNNKPVTMGINFQRFQTRTQTSAQWSNLGQQRFIQRQGRWVGVELPKADFQPQLSTLPYIFTSNEKGKTTVRAGADLRYTATSTLTGVASIQPDFGNIEGAVEGIGFSRTERFVPERRPFFLDGAGFLEYGRPFQLGRLFYSRRIQNFDAGLKVYGKLSPVDSLGVLATADFGNRIDAIGRYEHTISPTSTAGVFFSQKDQKDKFKTTDVNETDNSNTIGLLQSARFGKLNINSQLVSTNGTNAGGQGKYLQFGYQSPTVFNSLTYRDVDKKFRMSQGLDGFTDYKGFSSFNFWGTQWRQGFWRSFNLSFFPAYEWRQNGKPFRRGLGFNGSLQTRSDWEIGVGADDFYYDEQHDQTYNLFLNKGVTNRFAQAGLMYSGGKQGGKNSSFWGPTASYRVLKALDIVYAGAFQNLDGHNKQNIVTTNYTLSPTQSLGGRIVQQNKDTNWYLSYRNSGKKGTEVYFLFGDPNTPKFTQKATLKFVFAY
jgi:Carbohydrate family 9 binding domain-like/Domain of unknown function (DUF5916)